ncbi:PDR/VanB family oxidoreductase [Modestobacter sp. Leaf380]|uniref:PDR/VanB family oxidoreductase n=1 Tax=Modestobacter sp. Leaf380 TaxID=1736356 RepID=UPI000700291D|nr:PDR/VanB family oxidoreductase [Modestobacter sp. Leaf380]KQS68747.1 ferredoxin [Modestobacter sp. Leaf380]
MSFFSDVERDLVVAGRTVLADGVLAVDLVSHNGRDLPAWTPGSHLDLLLGPGLERQYSLCGDLTDRTRWRVAVLREDAGRGGSVAVHERVEVGQRLRVRGPRNHFPFDPAAGARHHLVAGGIGITPLRSMAAAAEEAGADWTLDYAGRSRSTMAFADELAAAHPGRVRVLAADEGGRLDVGSLAALPAGAQVHVCGPARLIDAVVEAGAALGLTVHAERFEAVEFGAPVWDGPFEVELALSGTTVTVEPGQTVLEAVEAEDVLVLSSCREGTCGTCETPVLEGDVEHRDSILSDGERASNTVMMVCVSRAAGPRLVLDL